MKTLKNEISLTKNESALLLRLANNKFKNYSVFKASPWTYNVLKTKGDNATFGSLLRKGVVQKETDTHVYYSLTAAAWTARLFLPV